MIDTTLAMIATFKDAGDHEAAHTYAVELARDHPNDVRTQMAAAYASDRLGLEHEALTYYERAWQLGIPSDERPWFMLGFGSTLRNVGRAEDAVTCLTEATREYPENTALLAFLALALHSAGRPRAALAAMLKAARAAAKQPGGFEGYERALAEYQEELEADV